MKLTSLSIRNFRTIESLDIDLPVSYAALCGPNDSGKTNVIRAIRALMTGDEPSYFPGDDEEVSVKDDFPKWLDTAQDSRSIVLTICLAVDENRDAGFYQFVVRQLQLKDAAKILKLAMQATYTVDKSQPKVSVTCEGETYEGLDDPVSFSLST